MTEFLTVEFVQAALELAEAADKLFSQEVPYNVSHDRYTAALAAYRNYLV